MLRSRDALKVRVDRITTQDAELAGEIGWTLAMGDRPEWLDEATSALRSLAGDSPSTSALVAPIDGEFVEETIVLRMGRPVVNIVDGAARLEFLDAGSETWRTRLEASAEILAPAIRSIGRVEVANHPSGRDYMGTGWLIDDGVVATNRHVALTFAGRGGEGFRFLTGFDRKAPIGVHVDFLEELENERQDAVKVVEVLHIAKDNEPDVAFLRLDPAAPARAAKPIGVSATLIPQGSMVAVVGYPARDTRVPDALLMDRIFGRVYDKKRLAPGLATGTERGALLHDCTTLGGNSGSPLIDLASGEVCGLHFSGAFLQSNYAVPSPVVKRMLADVRGTGGRVRTTPVGGATVEVDALPAPATSTELTVIIPIEVTIRVGGAQRTTVVGDPTAAVASVTEPDGGVASVEDAVVEARGLLGQRPDVYAVEAGWEFSEGWLTGRRAVVVAVRSKLSPGELEARGVLSMPKSVLGVPVDIRVAGLEDLAPGLALEAPSRWTSTYKRLEDEAELLAEVDEEMTVVAHASPDAGWPQLSRFLAATTTRLTVGMYDFTAPHVIDGVLAAVRKGRRRLTMVLEAGESLSSGTKKDDIPEVEMLAEFSRTLRARFRHASAATGGQRSPFKSAYHIKVAVRDGQAFWLSSGNWQSSNLPTADPLLHDTSPPLLSTHNREWHVVVENERLARTFERYLSHDFEQATGAVEEGAVPEAMVWAPAGLFQPSDRELEAPPQYHPALELTRRIRVQPLLTPDNYSSHVVRLIRSATDRVYFQNQSLSILAENPVHFEELIEALKAKQRAGLDVRIMIRKIGDVRKTVSRIMDRGFDMDRFRLQTNCHTKALIIDGRAVLLGSHNWTGEGTGLNRDASLIFFDSEVAMYYERLFLTDWERVGPPRIDESLPAPEIADPSDPMPRPGMLLIPLSHWLGDT